MRAAHHSPMGAVPAVDDPAAFLGPVRAVVGATLGFEVAAEAQRGSVSGRSRVSGRRTGPQSTPC